MIRIESISKKHHEAAINLVLSVFMQYEACDYSKEGINTFKAFISNPESTDSLEFNGAYINNEIIGVIATRNNGNHIALFFVDGRYHRQGIGRKLFQVVLEKSTGNKITVNSSPYAVEIYKKLGFTADTDEQIKEGIRFTPMTYTKFIP